METGARKLYEGMFLIDSAEAAKDWDGVIELIKGILTKAGAEIVSVRKWDERALAYPIRKVTRGTYILTYFKADGRKIRDIERDVRLSDRIMRVLILRADHLTEADVTKQPPEARCEDEDEQAGGEADEAGREPEQVEPRRAGADNVSASQTAKE